MDIETAILKATEKLGVKELKEKQYEAVVAFLEGNDVFLVVPTGYGKSIVYGILPLAFDLIKGKENDSIVICVSPLTSIMLDQADKFTSRGLCVGYIGEGQHDSSVSEGVLKGRYQLVLISPENIINDTPYRNMLLTETYKRKVVGLAVDEAHCVQTWGNKFRTSFARLGELRSLLPPGTNIIGLTATATHDTLDSVKMRLTMYTPVIIGLPPERANIFYSVAPYLNILQLSDYLMRQIEQQHPNCSKMVIFCPTLDLGSKLTKCLRFKLVKRYGTRSSVNLVDMFNKACSITKRQQVIESFCKEDSELRIIVASTSFGMGVDCPNIRTIIHWGPPDDLDTYVQETGRAGRDGLSSRAILLYGHPGQYVSEGMKLYGTNSVTCRREILYRKFLFFGDIVHDRRKCTCCDICSYICECDQCIEI